MFAFSIISRLQDGSCKSSLKCLFASGIYHISSREHITFPAVGLSILLEWYTYYGHIHFLGKDISMFLALIYPCSSRWYIHFHLVDIPISLNKHRAGSMILQRTSVVLTCLPTVSKDPIVFLLLFQCNGISGIFLDSKHKKTTCSVWTLIKQGSVTDIWIC